MYTVGGARGTIGDRPGWAKVDEGGAHFPLAFEPSEKRGSTLPEEGGGMGNSRFGSKLALAGNEERLGGRGGYVVAHCGLRTETCGGGRPRSVWNPISWSSDMGLRGGL